MSPERRKHKRIERNSTATLASLMGDPIIECALKDISIGGARVVVEVPEVVPDYFILRIEELGARLSPKCRVRWRARNEVGIEFFRPV